MIENKKQSNTEAKPEAYRYLALGDSYTIGEGVKAENTFPFLVVEMLEKEGFNFLKPKVIAKTGWTSAELLDAVKQEKLKPESYDVVSLLIGVNNQYRGQTLVQFKSELIELIEISLQLIENNNKQRLVLVSIPDWGVTTFGKSAKKPQDQIKNEIDTFNEVIKQEASKYGLHYLNITDSYRLNGATPINMVADGLHPSSYIYEEWAIQISILFREM